MCINSYGVGRLSCSINFNRRGKKVEVVYVPDEDIDYYYEDVPKPIMNALKQRRAELKLLEEV